MTREPRVWAGTELGANRVVNEDALAIIAPAIVAVIDGTGSAHDGRVISGPVLADALRARLAGGLALADALAAAGRDLALAAPNCGATVAAIELGATHVTIAHVGDCRVYRWRAGALAPMTRDHTLVNAFLDEHAHRLGPDERAELEARYGRVITRALGFADAVAEVRVEPLVPGDRWLLCTDGAYALADDARLAVLAGADDPGASVDALLADARVRGADNATLAIVSIDARAT